MQAWAKEFYNTKAWKKCRASYISYRQSIDGGLCETCHDRIGYIVHHKKWLTPYNINNPDITLNHENLKYDCLICHNQEKQEAQNYYFDDEGQIHPLPPIEE